MRILFLTYHFPTPSEPGAGRPWETARTLRELGHEPVVITAGTHYMTGEDVRKHRKLLSVEEIDGFRVIKTFAFAGYRRSIWRRLCNYLSFALLALVAGFRERKCDAVLMATDPIFIGPVGLLLSVLRRCRLILDERDLYPDTAIALGYLTSRPAIAMLEKWQNALRRRAVMIISATPGIRRILIEKGISSDKIFVFPNVRAFSANGVADAPEDWLRIAKAASIARWREQFVVLYIGKFGQANDLDTIMRAARRLNGLFPGIRFALIGDGEKLDDCRRFIDEQHMNNVDLLGPLSWEATRRCVETASAGIQCFVNNPFWRCALSTKIFDYMLASKPVVFAGEGDSADLIAAAHAGIVVDPENDAALAEAIIGLSQDPARCTMLGRQGRQYVESKFSRERQVETMRKALSAA